MNCLLKQTLQMPFPVFLLDDLPNALISHLGKMTQNVQIEYLNSYFKVQKI